MTTLSQPSSNCTRILLLGGGYVSIWAYRSIYRKLRGPLRRGEVEITVVSPDNYHYFHGWSGESIGGIIGHTHHHSPLRTIFRQARLVRGRALEIDSGERCVTVQLSDHDSRTRRIGYDHLVLGMGVKDRTEEIPGLAAHGHVLRRTGGLLGLRNQIFQTLERADAVDDPEERKRLLSFVVAGGGFAGTEMCAALAELLGILRRYYPVLREHDPTVTLLHAGERLVPELRPRYNKLANYAARQLDRYGIDVRRETRLKSVLETSVVLNDGCKLPASVVLAAVGTVPVKVAGMETFERDTEGRVYTDEYLRVRGTPNIWTGGDAAHVKHVQTGEPCPANALWAIKHGEWLGSNVARSITNQSLERFTYRGLGQAASYGIGKGALELYGFQFTGWFAWIARLGFFLFFMPAWIQRVHVIIDWISLPILGRTLIPLSPPAETKRLAASHSEVKSAQAAAEYSSSDDGIPGNVRSAGRNSP